MKRYELEYDGDIYTMEEDEEGEYVRHEDVKRILDSVLYFTAQHMCIEEIETLEMIIKD